MTPRPRALRTAYAAAAVGCVAAVTVFGELSTGALVAVCVTGGLVALLGVAVRAGEAAPPVGRRAVPWLGWLAAGLAWEAVTLLSDDLPTVSDLADPLLAHPPARGTATAVWLAAGAWLVTRPSRRAEPA